ncbi:MAG: hypothetical protein Q8K70_04545 [Bacteroidota bacterium]|nr:hypothetical protein [Bacteroidota bacterium]
MPQKEVLNKIQEITRQINASISEIENHQNIEFHSENIKSLSIQIHQLITQKTTPEKPVVSEIKIIKKEEIQQTPNLPVEKIEEPIKAPEPIQEIIEKIEEKPIEVPAPIIEQVIVEDIKPAVEVQNHLQKTYEEQNDHDSSSNAFNDKLSKSGTPPLNIADKLKETPIKDLAKSIAISKKFEFINTLFDGKAEDYKNCINTIQNASSYQDAISFLDSQILQQFDWQDHEKLSEEFFSLVRRKFLL